MPDPKEKLFEHAEGIFVTRAMINQLPTVSAKEEATLSDVVERLDRIEMLIKYIFDGHVLINGWFRRIEL